MSLLGFGKPRPVEEYEAEGGIERIYHEIRQVFRVTGVNLVFRVLAAYPRAFPLLWAGIRPLAESRLFETRADRLRAAAVAAAVEIGAVEVRALARLGESQAYQVRSALALYHYVNPKLLLMTSTVLQAWHQDGPAGERGEVGERIERGEPSAMVAMEMVPEDPDDERLKAIFRDIIEVYGLSSINSDYRTLGLWPDYLSLGWERLKSKSLRDDYRESVEALRGEARRLAAPLVRSMPGFVPRLMDTGDDLQGLRAQLESFEQLLSPLILNVALLGLEWTNSEAWAGSPFPARSRCEQGADLGRAGSEK